MDWYIIQFHCSRQIFGLVLCVCMKVILYLCLFLCVYIHHVASVWCEAGSLPLWFKVCSCGCFNHTIHRIYIAFCINSEYDNVLINFLHILLMLRVCKELTFSISNWYAHSYDTSCIELEILQCIFRIHVSYRLIDRCFFLNFII